MRERLNYISSASAAYTLHNKSVHPPMRSVKELASEFGITARYLNSLMLKKSNLEPYLITGIGLHRKYYYKLSAAREWWAKHLEEKHPCLKLVEAKPRAETQLNS